MTHSEVSVPVAVLHVIELVWWSHDGTGYPGVPSCPPGEEFKVWSGLVLVTLEAVIEAPVRLVVVLPRDPTPNTEL